MLSYPYMPGGGGFYVAPASDVTVTPDPRVQSDGTSIIELNISWTASPDPLLDHYAVDLSADGGATYFSAGSAGAGATSITYQPALANTNYIARVTAISSMVGGLPASTVSSAPTDSGPLAPFTLRPFGATFSAADISTKPLGVVVARFPAPFAWTLQATTSTPAGYCEGQVDVAPIADVSFPLLKDGVAVGSAKWVSGSQTPILVKAADTDFALGDYLDLQMPANLHGMSGVFGLVAMGTR